MPARLSIRRWRSASISTMPAPRRSRTTKMTIVTRTVRPRNRPSGAPAATGQPDPLAAPASPVVGAVWPTRNAWSIRGQASSSAMIRIRPIAEEMTCHHENGFVGARCRTRRRRNAWTRIATTKLTKTTRNRSPRSGSKTPNALGSVPPEAPPPGGREDGDWKAGRREERPPREEGGRPPPPPPPPPGGHHVGERPPAPHRFSPPPRGGGGTPRRGPPEKPPPAVSGRRAARRE